MVWKPRQHNLVPLSGSETEMYRIREVCAGQWDCGPLKFPSATTGYRMLALRELKYKARVPDKGDHHAVEHKEISCRVGPN
jgi:hypothetical protein